MGSVGVWECGSLDITRANMGSLGVWESGSLGVWESGHYRSKYGEFGSLGVWESGSVGVWTLPEQIWGVWTNEKEFRSSEVTGVQTLPITDGRQSSILNPQISCKPNAMKLASIAEVQPIFMRSIILNLQSSIFNGIVPLTTL